MHRRPLSLLTACLTTIVASAQQPISLFDGKSLEGWDFNPAIWRVENGVITGGSRTERIQQNHFISTKKSYMNFELKLAIRCSGDPATGLINSGIQIRSRREGESMSGYQVDCGAGWFGKIYDEHRRNQVIAQVIDQAALDKVIDVFGWNEYRILAEGPRIRTWINGVLAHDYTETDPNVALDGHIAPQVHSGGVCLVEVRDITIVELPPTPGAPTWEKVGHLQPKTKPKAKAPSAPQGRDISYNEVQGTALSAKEQLKKFKLPQGYEIELVVQESDGIGKFVSVYFDHRGRMWTQTALEYPVDANENPAAAEAVYASQGKDKVLVYPRESLNSKIPDHGLSNPTVFADGLAIPLGILPWGNGDTCYVQHGHDLKLYKDTDGDGKADTFDVVLTGFGVQDSHLFPHQFTRAPGGWIWMAQGLFNHSLVRKPGSDQVTEWAKCSMARMRPDGEGFEVISTGPNNIWGLVITRAGEAFIQEANDYGYPVIPFHEYAYYPGGMEALKKSYQPDFPPQAEFRMGGTGLSGLALIESGPLRDHQATYTMAVANPITSKVQTIAMHRDAAWWKLTQLPDFITCEDPFFRPVALTNGPDGCIYIVDWYNKIISHNEVPRAHPDRDKTRGRIWRVKPTGANPEVPDFTQLSPQALEAHLSHEPVGRAHLAWQELQDRKQLPENHWAAREYMADSQIGRINQIGRNLTEATISTLLTYAQPSLPGPTRPSSRGVKPIPVRQAYDREFERFLVRMFLERRPDIVTKFLDSEEAGRLPVEALVLATLALEPQSSAARVAKLLPRLDRAPNEEELLRLAQFPNEPGVGASLKALLANEKTRLAVAENLLAHRTKLNAPQIAPLLTDAARALLRQAPTVALQLIGGFQLTSLEDDLLSMTQSDGLPPPSDSSRTELRRATLLTLRDLRSAEADHFATIAQTDPDSPVREAALEALAASRSPHAGTKLLALFPSLELAQRRSSLSALSSTKSGARTIVTALLDKSLPQTDLDGPTVERIATVLGDDPALDQLQQLLGAAFREVLLFNGQDSAWVDANVTLEGPFTLEAWVKLAPGIGNEDCLLGVPGGIQLNFFQSRFRVYAGPELHDVCVSNKPITPDMWTHLAVTRDAEGNLKLYQNGELDAVGTKPAPQTWEGCRIGWSGPAKGTEGAVTEFRLWGVERTAEQIREGFDRSYASNRPYKSYPTKPMTATPGVRLAKTIDTPPLLTEQQAQALEAKFDRLTALAEKGNAENGKPLRALCLSCHQIGSEGAQIGPNLSGVGAMGLEAILRNILTPNAAMEPGYRIYRAEMKNGDLVDAFYVSEDTDAVIVRQPGTPDRRLPKGEIRSTRFIRRSLMPEGLLDALPDQQAADLLAYLLTLKG